jgi:hypothetical protein
MDSWSTGSGEAVGIITDFGEEGIFFKTTEMRFVQTNNNAMIHATPRGFKCSIRKGSNADILSKSILGSLGKVVKVKYKMWLCPYPWNMGSSNEIISIEVVDKKG